eukprot:TRINITY_DN2233_c0_g4_i3.p1 TRINITY_DN2233_c0_g4~~TRINITY_DN2233_c0_g4_i3.p1  ORF type:complete len:372 (-),score=24.38 TRINITY_DN2233_c0_g4_i3:191-1306(-)
MGIAFGLGFFNGLFFDRFGARVAAVFGAILGAVGALLVYISLLREDLNWIVFIGMAISDACGNLSSLAILGFLYHYPSHQAFVITLGTVSYLLSGFLGQVMIWVETYTFITNGKSFLAVGCACLVSACIHFFSVPSKKEYYDVCELALGYRSEPQAAQNCSGLIQPVLDSLKKVGKIMYMYKVASLSYFLNFLTMSTLVFQQIGQLTYLTTHYVSPEAGVLIGQYYIFISMGATVAQVLGSLFYDKFGSKVYLNVCTAFFLASMLVFFILPGQITSLVLVLVSLNMLLVWGNKWAALFAPPDLIGTFKAVLQAAIGIVQLGFSIWISTSVKGIESTMILFGVLASVSVCTYAFHYWYVIIKGVPLTPPQLQ